MNAKDNGHDNACAKSLFLPMKVEVIHGDRFAAGEKMRSAVFEYVAVD